MPTFGVDIILPTNGTEGFFNELETDIVATITTNGTGYYKLTQQKGSGTFTAVEAVTELPDTAILHEYGDRYTLEGDGNCDYLFVHFQVV